MHAGKNMRIMITLKKTYCRKVPGGGPHLRYLCKQLRARFPSLPLVVGCWGASEPVAETVALLRADGLDHIGATVQTTRDHIMHVSQLVASQRALRMGGMSDPTVPGPHVVLRQPPRASTGASEQGAYPDGAPDGGTHQPWPVVTSPPPRDGLWGHGDGPWLQRGS